ncbi:ABC transporter ATP-binding protein [Leptospira sp. GIMC2001]|uniref:ABC transporter ATP-binding protein n=1 Tax=Leptospira sp. GIMC2001 TaxID=1513297 RepID=UPI002348F6E1|nr:ABC transporter ATP-binding protein [Leptospira sp. GIMC2001]WCL51260.1 ABC transporter ATP-binding protein [Leptospira sp. GIMC2001]
MNELAIQLENVNKTFRIYDKPIHRLKELFNFSERKYYTDFDALKDINLEIKKGEFIGVVGRNGAGKSTLLRILSRELTPSSGMVNINGIVSLLQLGVGFDNELTGVDNARFASKLLGYSDDQIEIMLKDIIEFADIGEFIYHPIKTYSSGMYSRLSFAIGINIDPDILIADEVLSVGDMKFSQKCLRKMHEFKEKGKTLILVTHSPEAIKSFCDRSVWIHDGRIFMDSDSKKVMTDYINFMVFNRLPEQVDSFKIAKNDSDKLDTETDDHEDRLVWDYGSVSTSSIGTMQARILRAALCYENRERVTIVNGNPKLTLLAEFEVFEDIKSPSFGWMLYDDYGKYALHTNTDICDCKLEPLKAGKKYLIKFNFTLPSLKNGDFIFSLGLRGDDDEMLHRLQDILPIKVFRDDIKSQQLGYVIMEDDTSELIEI